MGAPTAGEDRWLAIANESFRNGWERPGLPEEQISAAQPTLEKAMHTLYRVASDESRLGRSIGEPPEEAIRLYAEVITAGAISRSYYPGEEELRAEQLQAFASIYLDIIDGWWEGPP
ncbi:hypothetical protein [Streptomyces sp. NPDC058872]|uniref:hypothetical protein n=1 Tax=Streptomyces sp. NPDC058872 TaxID=3346661 RepID=UPI0036886488